MSDLFADDAVRHVEIAVETPRGTWPTEGFFLAPARQSIARQLKRAASDLQLQDTEHWEAVIEGKTLDVGASFIANRLKGRVVIRYGPAVNQSREGGK